MERVIDKIDFGEEEEKISEFWRKSNVFRNSLKQSVTNKKFSFFDGPPFATGLPHYGHVLTGTVKDIATRFAHQTGHYVGRRFGWDCHGLPVEYEIDKALGITGPQDVEKMGLANYNAECRKIVMRYSHEWEVIMGRLARWIDFEDDYKTMYPWYMESIWFVFRELYMKGLVYRGVKVMPYSTACNTPLSNFESGQNYQDVVDPQVTIGFPLENEPSVQLVAWTTTPWTLPSNLAVCVHPTLIYVRVQSLKNNAVYIMMECRLCVLFKKPEEYKILDKFPGEKLGGLRYKPLFPYFAHLRQKGAFQVLVDKYVTDDAGTGVVQQAPYFGEDDYRICLAAGVITRDQEIVCPIDASGRFVEPVKDFLGLHVKEADKFIIKKLKEESPHRLLDASTVKHSYPFCWRSETPLIYRAVPSWFIRVEPLIDSLLSSNQSTYWVPDFVKEKRFGNWLRGARDWAVSRNRYWGTPIPIWQSEDGKECVCVGSIEELEQLTGRKITDIHRESIDDLTIPSARPGMPPLRRVPEVFDCWFESGSMPYAQLHFPFSRDIEINFHESFPADFISEGIDQTRGWFYTLLVISTAIFNKAPFRNLLANGLVLASDGQKMSKRKKNYPDPLEIVHRYGADALRLYLIDSPVVRAENLRFKEEGVRDVLKDVMLPWYNAYRYLAQSIERLITEDKVEFMFDEGNSGPVSNPMDRWIKSTTQTLITTVWKEMKLYRLYKVVPVLIQYIDNLTNWYIRMNRGRLKGDEGLKESTDALGTLFEVLWLFVRVMAPFTPYICELMFQNLKKQLPQTAAAFTMESVHFLPLPQPVSLDIDLEIERRVHIMQFIISTGRIIRDKRTVPLKYPLPALIVIHKDKDYLNDLKAMENYILKELNIKELILSSDCDKYGVTLAAKVDHKVLGARLKGDFKAVLKAVQDFSDLQVQEFLKNQKIDVMGHTLTLDDVFISYQFADGSYSKEKYEAHSSQEAALLMDMQRDAAMFDEGLAREVINLVQKLRKKAQLVPTDPVTVFYQVLPSEQETIVSSNTAYIETALRVPLRSVSGRPAEAISVIKESCQLKGAKVTIELEIVPNFASDWSGVRQNASAGEQLSECQNEDKKVVAASNKSKSEKATKVKVEKPSNEVNGKTSKAKEPSRATKLLSNSSTFVPDVSYVIVKVSGVKAKKDPFEGLIIPLENPSGLNAVLSDQLKKLACHHFGLNSTQTKLSCNGETIADSNVPVPERFSGQFVILQPSDKECAQPDLGIPNQPFANVHYGAKKGVVFLTKSSGVNLSADEILGTAADLFKLKKDSVELTRLPNGPSNSLVLRSK